MKRFLALALMTLTTMFYSCSSDSDNSSLSSGSMSAKIDGQSWSSQLTAASITEIGFDGGGMALQILGTKTNNSSFTMVIPLTSLSVGSHTYSGFAAEGSLGYFTPAFDMYSSDEDQGTFTVNITDIDLDAGKISGTFSGTLVSFDEATSVSITEGKFTDVTMVSQSFYSNGTMSLSRNGGAGFEMDEVQDDGKYLILSENSMDNNLTMYGYNANLLTTDYGIYMLTIPLDAAPGTYSLTNNSDFKAALGSNENAPEYEITAGSITIISHNNKNMVGTFNFTANNGVSTVNITNGSFDVTHK
jgi:uncharacterized protein DUF6252